MFASLFHSCGVYVVASATHFCGNLTKNSMESFSSQAIQWYISRVLRAVAWQPQGWGGLRVCTTVPTQLGSIPRLLTFLETTMRFTILALALLLSACDKPAPVAAPEVIVPQGKETSLMCEPKWCYGEKVLESLTPRMLAADPGIYCPKHKQVNMREFWVAFSKAVHRAESNWSPTHAYTENFIDKLTGKKAESVGLWQLSVGDKLNYKTPNCKDLTAEKLRNAQINLACGLEIIDARLQRDVGKSFKDSLGKYWSTIRDNKNATDSSKSKAVTLVDTVARYLPACF